MMFRLPRTALRPRFAMAAGFGAALMVPHKSQDDDQEDVKNLPPPVVKTTMFNGWKATLETHQAPCVTVKFNLGPWGKTQPFTYTSVPLSPADAEKKLTQNQTQLTVNRTTNPLVQIDSNFLPGNTTTEDAHAFDMFSKTDLPALLGEGSFWETWYKLRTSVIGEKRGVWSRAGDGSKDLIMASVFDGHGGAENSQLASKALHACISRAIARDSVEGCKKDMATILTETFEAYDNDLLSAPEQIVKGHLKGPENPLLPNPPPSLFSLRSIDGPGACSITAVIDIEKGDLWVANMGDCRCVAGWYDTATHTWRCDVLSRDMTADDPEEAAAYFFSHRFYAPTLIRRILAAHPNEDPKEVLIDRGYGYRPLGTIQPTRALGDQNCKARTNAQNDSIRDVLCLENNGSGRWFLPHVSPPYIGNTPEIAHRKIKSENGTEQLRFLILGVDGLFDRLTSEEATLIMAAHLTGAEQPSIARADLPNLFKLAPATEKRPWPQQPLPGSSERNDGVWHFQDLNAATHLMRNAMPGFGDPEIRRQVLSLTGNGARQMRDDTTAMYACRLCANLGLADVRVLLFDEDGLAYTSKQM